ncbi:MAG TPA: BatD family protein [Bacteroidales bacterium]|nr:BatD family protein [Bacteroidales bacterium]HRZ48653.1 BatD family protein [Bacteroidales bacterium]
MAHPIAGNKTWLLLFILALFLPGRADGQALSFTTEAPEEVLAGAAFQVVYVLNREVDQFEGPDMKGLEILGGPGYSVSSYTAFVNGRRSTETKVTYTYALKASKAGRVQLGPAHVKIGKTVYKSKPIAIQVIGSSTSENRQGNQDNSEGDIFISNIISNTNPYKGEVIVLTQKLYTRLSIQNIGGLKVPSFNGFWFESIPTDHYQVVQEMYKGRPYNTIILNTTLLIPLKTGIITIEPSSLPIERVVERTVNRQLWGGIIQQKVRELVENEIRSSAVKIQVREAPAVGKPETYTGAVGDFTMEASVAESDVEVGEPAELKIVIQGTGNLKLIDKPQLNLPASLETFEPETADRIKTGVSGMSGRREYTWLIIPRETGLVELPEITFTYLNPATGKYMRNVASGLKFNAVNTGKKKVNTANMGRDDVRYLGKDIRYIETELRRPILPWIAPGSWIHLLGLVLPVLLLTILLLYFRKYLRLHADKEKMRAMKAKATAIKRLKQASEALRKNDVQEYYNVLLNSVWGYATDRLGLKASMLSKARVREELLAKGADPETADTFLNIITECEYCRYAPSPMKHHREKMYVTAEKCIIALETQLTL